HIIAGHTSTDRLVIYPQRFVGQDIFEVRSHHNRGTYRAELAINTDRDLVLSGNKIILNGGSEIDTGGTASRWKQSDNNYIIQNSSGQVNIYAGGTSRHVFR